MKSNQKSINHWVFWPPFILMLATVVLNFANYDLFTNFMHTSFDWIVNNFGWFFSLTAFIFVVVAAAIAFSSVGNIRFGGENAKPEFSTWNWFAISICAGIGTGIVFWGVAEPMMHFATPPASLGIQPFSAQAALFAMSTVNLHWTITPYAMYVICAIPIALAYYNYKQPLTVSSSLYFLIGDKCQGGIGKIVDIICLYAIVGGVAGSLGTGLLQIGSGVEYVSGIKSGPLVWAVIAVLIVAAYTFSSYSGLKKGIKILSDLNTKLFFGVMLFVLLAGPTSFIPKIGIEGLGVYLGQFFEKSMFLSSVAGDQWPSWWTLFYWAIWFAFAPIVGLFLVRMTYGRTLRQFISVNLLMPAIFGMVWFAIFGGTAIHMQLSGSMDLWKSISTNGVENAIFAFFSTFPLGSIVVPVFLFIICISFITLADSMTTSIAGMSTKGLTMTDSEAPLHLKVVWGVLMGAVAWVMICFAGIDGVKMVSVLAGFPIAFLMLIMVISVVKGLWWPGSKAFFGDEKCLTDSAEKASEIN
ncbi:choline-glycine betaine transporter [Desulfosporosinus orientis DSM 765]|uniref:Choline-glycine betaine transporter n=1 Tax=Desulfosporosinus orientis (strain ATCC 19365 / DSM 765 / NCIMB 8382 / VKM B-1628 / Singapore I) TaxID=768706 RepID=G7W6Y4_DESOD|nr:BCCT family transporter [Desulfosporosinus orientis]AET69841.1 choline-glycine betaine transporter [Desulfosporosinus orientis DSM 765]